MSAPLTVPKPGPQIGRVEETEPEPVKPQKVKAGEVLHLVEPTAALHLLPGMTIFEPKEKGQSVDARTPGGERLHRRGKIRQVVQIFTPDYTIVILDDRKRWRYEQVAPVWAEFIAEPAGDEDDEA